MKSIHDLVARIESMDRRLKALSRPKLAQSSIQGGAMMIRDELDTARGKLGLQTDGTYALSWYSGPTPAQPAAPTITAIGTVGLLVQFTGWTGGANTPSDLRHVEVAISTKGEEPTDDDRVGYLDGFNGGGITVLWPTGKDADTHEVRLAGRNLSGVLGPWSPGHVEPEPEPVIYDVGVIPSDQQYLRSYLMAGGRRLQWLGWGSLVFTAEPGQTYFADLPVTDWSSTWVAGSDYYGPENNVEARVRFVPESEYQAAIAGRTGTDAEKLAWYVGQYGTTEQGTHAPVMRREQHTWEIERTTGTIADAINSANAWATGPGQGITYPSGKDGPLVLRGETSPVTYRAWVQVVWVEVPNRGTATDYFQPSLAGTTGENWPVTIKKVSTP